MKSILILFHCESNTGYAIATLERTFFEMAKTLCGGDIARIHFAYPRMTRGPSPSLPVEFKQYVVIDANSRDKLHQWEVEKYIANNGIDTLFGFDQGAIKPMYKAFRRAGIRHFIAYWGAPISSINNWFVRLIKKALIALDGMGPDHYIFESEGMANLAIRGRGISRSRVSVVYLGVDTERFRPDEKDASYIYANLQIPGGRRVFFYSGHMEARKGIAVIMQAANELSRIRVSGDWHFVLCGNKGDESAGYEAMLSYGARAHVTFAGYRSDIHRLQHGCYVGIIASTGWDSLTCSSVEMQASGLPLLVSDLPGLREAILDEVTGFTFPVGDAGALVRCVIRLLDDQGLRDLLGRQARIRTEKEFSQKVQLDKLTMIVRTQTIG